MEKKVIYNKNIWCNKHPAVPQPGIYLEWKGPHIGAYCYLCDRRICWVSKSSHLATLAPPEPIKPEEQVDENTEFVHGGTLEVSETVAELPSDSTTEEPEDDGIPF